MVIVLVFLIAVLLVIGVPVAAAFGLASMVYLAASPQLPELLAVKSMVEGIDSFTLLAIPFFVLAGNLMTASGITRQIFDLAGALVGHFRGGLAQVDVVNSIIFSGMSGSAVADAGGLGAVAAREMVRHGYDPGFAAGVTSSSATIGPILPPSIPMLVFAMLASVSVKDLFLAALVPGALLSIGLFVLVWYISVRRGYPTEGKFSLGRLGRSFIAALPALLTPILLVGGITLGVVTPTESALIAVFYALAVSIFAYREMDWRGYVKVIIESIETTATIMVILGTAAVFAWILANEGVPQSMTRILLSWTTDPTLLAVTIVVGLLIIGTVLEAGAAMVILVPVILPVADAVGIDRTHLGILVVFTLMIGLVTPPVGLVLFVLSKAASIPINTVIKGTIPFLIPLIATAFLLAVFPQLSLAIPQMLK